MNDDSKWIDTLVDGEEDVDGNGFGGGAVSSPAKTPVARSVAAQSHAVQSSPYPPWFSNVPGHTPKELADMIWNKTMPQELQQFLKKRQMEFFAEQQHMQHMAQQVQESRDHPGQPPVPTQLLQSLSNKQEQRDHDLFDRHHHTNLVFWKRNFKYMSSDEIDNLLSQQRSMLKHSNFAEDYYYQVKMGRQYPHEPPPKSFPPVMGIHLPICLEPLDHPLRPEGDMFVGVLGKIPFASLKSPKPIVALEDAPHNQFKATTSRAIRALENNCPNRNALFHVIEDGLLLALHLSDLTETIVQLPHSERAPFVAKQQQTVASLVYILNVFVLRRPQGPYFPSLLHVSKGCKWLTRCLSCLPREQKTALILVCLSSVSVFPEQVDASLVEALRRECVLLPIENAVGGLITLSQAFSSLQAFQQWTVSKLGPLFLGSLLQSIHSNLENSVAAPKEWPAVYQGLFESVSAVLPRLLERAKESGDSDPAWNFLLHLSALASPPHLLFLTSALSDVTTIPSTSKNASALRRVLKI